MMLAPEKRTKFIFLNHATSSAILRMPTSGFEPRTPPDGPEFDVKVLLHRTVHFNHLLGILPV